MLCQMAHVSHLKAATGEDLIDLPVPIAFYRNTNFWRNLRVSFMCLLCVNKSGKKRKKPTHN